MVKSGLTWANGACGALWDKVMRPPLMPGSPEFEKG
ncbi:hypothetical protein ABH932_007094 [Streptacidiphilus sp. MAP5-52]